MFWACLGSLCFPTPHQSDRMGSTACCWVRCVSVVLEKLKHDRKDSTGFISHCQGTTQNYFEFECNSACKCRICRTLQNPYRMVHIVVFRKQNCFELFSTRGICCTLQTYKVQKVQYKSTIQLIITRHLFIFIAHQSGFEGKTTHNKSCTHTAHAMWSCCYTSAALYSQIHDFGWVNLGSRVMAAACRFCKSPQNPMQNASRGSARVLQGFCRVLRHK